MLKVSLFLMTIVATSSCGGFKLNSSKETKVDRRIASLIINDEDQTFIDEVETKLLALHSYYTMGQKNLLEFDRLLPETDLKKLYQTTAYLNLSAIKIQVESLENELFLLYQKVGKKELFRTELKNFGKRSPLAHLSLENLTEKISGKSEASKGPVTFSDIAKEYRDLEVVKEFTTYEKNIEHLSYLYQTKKKSSSEDETLRAQDLPAKVWAVAFLSEGPSPSVIKNLKESSIKGSFLKTKSSDMDQIIRDAGVRWNIDALDWMAQSPDKIIKRTLLMMTKTSRDSGVILFHDTHHRGAWALSAITNHLKQNKRRTCTLGEIAKDMSESSEKVCLNN